MGAAPHPPVRLALRQVGSVLPQSERCGMLIATGDYPIRAGSNGGLMVEQQTSGSQGSGQRPLKGIAEIRHFFRTNTTPIFFLGATPFNLLGLDRWVRNFDYISYYDAWEGAHPRVFTPQDKPYIEFSSGEEINNYLLLHPEVRAYMQRSGWPPKQAK